MRISDWSSDVCSSVLALAPLIEAAPNRAVKWQLQMVRFSPNVPFRKSAIMRLEWHMRSTSSCAEVLPSRRPIQNHGRSEEHTSELQSLMRISYAVYCLKKKNIQ